MVEKWLQGKGNPYMNNNKPKNTPQRAFVGNPFGSPQRVPQRVPQKVQGTFRKTVAGHFGMPIQMFKDSDKDGVMNAFDCKPFNKRKQDVMHPQNFGGGLSDMYGRQESARLNAVYKKQLEELQRQEELRLEELRRLSNVQVIDNTQTIYKDTPYVTDGTGWYSATSKQGQAIVNKPVTTSGTNSSGQKYTTTTTGQGIGNKPMTVTITTIPAKVITYKAPAPAPKPAPKPAFNLFKPSTWKK